MHYLLYSTRSNNGLRARPEQVDVYFSSELADILQLKRHLTSKVLFQGHLNYSS